MWKEPYQIRTMTRKEVDLAIEWAAQEGWNPGLHDADNYYAADPEGFLIGLLGDEPIAVISAIRYTNQFAFLGFYIVKPEYRGQGYGIQIWNAAMQSLQGRNIALDGVVAQQENYRKSGFHLAYRNIRYEGTAATEVAVPSVKDDVTIVDARTYAFEDICAYDREFFPAQRRTFVKTWLNQPDSQAFVLLKNEPEHRDRVVGYGVIRKCRNGYKVGPLYADTPDYADQLFTALKSFAFPSEPVYLDVPEVNPQAVALAQRHQMTASFETARMYTGAEPELPLERLYGVTSFEIG
ncbi:GNAT family N-acetyltransferase [Vibrio mangrovi]|uniref:Acetyltransferase (GNAT) family protein n=1 Tax=Vibrio mangrovi TaxID=474394 RepID=A0A1Y6IT64_9VIBR|nr:GNAT family N-acetyltransferase [Vibrio mangrovi]MDW6003525.1 GNAT family N-acetyltransferase [Vibrio mangrovi]SMR99682.1 Acetyltransferase (GNAT) family protein [Vibrio mangrovi]